jgi:AbrB family looped-hinge helix DNA binding protein
MPLARVGPKGQVVIPKRVRDALGIEPGDRVVVDVDGARVVVTPLKVRRASDLLGILPVERALDVHEGRRDYQEHLVEKFRDRSREPRHG